MNEQELTEAIQSRLGIHLQSVRLGERTTEGWRHTAWRCTLTKDGSQQLWNGPYKTGMAIEAPTLPSVLHSLLLDMDGGNMTFADFCSEFGYDEDSRRAFSIYMECQAIAVQLARPTDECPQYLAPSEISTLRELLSDY